MLKSFEATKVKVLQLLRWSERYTKTDMVYVGVSSFWLGIGQMVNVTVSFVLSILFANYLSKEMYGIYKYILSLSGTFSAFSLNGMNTAVVRAVAQGRDGTFLKSLLPQLKWSFLQFVISAVVAVYYFVNNNDVYGFAFSIVAIFGPLSNVVNTFNSFLHGKQKFLASTVAVSITTLLYFLATATTIFYYPNIILLVASYYIVITLTNTFFCFRTIRKNKPIDNTLHEEDLSYAKHISIMNVLGMLAQQADNIIIYHFLGPSQLAIYSFSIILPDKVRSIMNTLSSAVLSKLSEKHGGDTVSIKRKIYQLSILGILSAVIYILIAQQMYELLFPQYLSSVVYSQFYALVLLTTPLFITIPALYATGNQKALYILNSALPAIKIVFSLIAVYWWGLLGAIVVRTAYYMATTVISTLYVGKKVSGNTN